MPSILIEAAIDSRGSAARAVAEGAGRLEVCANLDVGGLTPPVQLLRHCLALGVPCVAMARPRAGDFMYGRAERHTLREHASTLRDAGARGIVFGALARDMTIDEDAVNTIVELCSGSETIFHRAFDATVDASAALDMLIACGVTRILTSGQAATAIAGVDAIAAFNRHAAGRIEILPGGGVRADNVGDIVRRTRVSQVHARGTQPGVIAAMRKALDGEL